MLLSLATWLYPIHVASAKETNNEEAIFINYEQFHKTIQTVEPNTSRLENRRDNTSEFPARSNIQRPYQGRTYTKEEVQALIIQYSQQYGISADVPLRVARCESGFNQFAKNRSSTASGVYQWLASSWRNQPASVNGTVSVFDAEANIRAAVWLIAHNKISPWNASKHCWKQ